MKRHLVLLAACFILFLFPGLLQAQLPTGYSVTCDNGSNFDNGVEVKISQMRAGFTYTATAIGLNGFDPVLAVLDSNTGSGLCNDDDSDAAGYAANLPTTGSVPSSSLSAQVNFSQTSGNTFADISLVVGGYDNQSGEFLLILEGMGVTSGDGAGDPFSVNLTPGMVDSGVPLTIYMLARDASLDPTLYRTDSSLDAVTDQSGNVIGCDDAGNSDICWGESTDLSQSSVSTTSGRLPGGPYDAMLMLPISNVALNNDPALNYFNFVMTTSPQVTTQGQYVLAFHIGMTGAAPNGGGFSGGGESSGGSETVPTQVAQNNSGGAQMGVSVTCDNGTSFDNGVEIIVNQMRSGFTYTATAVGINGFDPVLAVLDTATGNGLCSDDDSDARVYAADLPTTGRVPASELSAQVDFSQTSGNSFANISLVVGGYGNQGGEFLLILEGMAATTEDNAGDIYDVNVTSGMVDSGVPLTIYMLARTNELDPYIVQTDAALNIVTDRSGDSIYCDDAGNGDLCWGQSVDLSDSSVTIGAGRLPGGQYDAMLNLILTGTQLNADRTQNYTTFVMRTSPQIETEGPYVLVFHIATTN